MSFTLLRQARRPGPHVPTKYAPACPATPSSHCSLLTAFRICGSSASE